MPIDSIGHSHNSVTRNTGLYLRLYGKDSTTLGQNMFMGLIDDKISKGVQPWPMELIKGGFIVAMKKPFTSAY